MAESEDQLETQLSKIYQEANIATGYILKANEVILCSSEESINMPHDTYGIVSSKFSYTQLGLSIELGTSVIQPGHTGKVHFQIQNNTENSICIYPHIQVAQLLFFRTVQPSSRNYSEDATNHSYDDESISPISRFRKNNESLATAHKPGDNFFKSILENLNSKLMEKVIGFLITAVFFIWNCSQMEELVVWLKSRFVNGMPITLIAFEIAVFGCILDQFFAFVGKILMYFGEKVVGWIREKIR
jgi:deoxycytidine triphosphate deaminase